MGPFAKALSKFAFAWINNLATSSLPDSAAVNNGV
jgi:hypothetical protein